MGHSEGKGISTHVVVFLTSSCPPSMQSASHAAAMALLEEKIRSLEAETATLAQERDSALYDQQEQVQSVQRQLDGSAGKIKELMVCWLHTVVYGC